MNDTAFDRIVSRVPHGLLYPHPYAEEERNRQLRYNREHSHRFVKLKRYFSVLSAFVVPQAYAAAHLLGTALHTVADKTYSGLQGIQTAGVCCATVGRIVLEKAADHTRVTRYALAQTGRRIFVRLLPQGKARLNVALFASSLAVLVFCSSFLSKGLEVYLNGQSIGFVSSQQEFETALQTVSAKVEKILGYSYAMTPNVSYHFSIHDRQSQFNAAQVEETLFNQVPAVKRMALLTINGRVAAAHTNPAFLQAQLDALLQKPEAAPDAHILRFVDEVSIAVDWTDASYESTDEDIRHLLTTPLRNTVTVSVQESESVPALAGKSGLSVATLQSLNPDLPLDALIPGTPVRVRKEVPFLSVEALETTVYSDVIAFETEYVDDPNLYTGKQVVRTRGESGSVEITADIRYVNGEAVDEIELSRHVTKEPVTQVVANGTRIRPATAPTGTFIRPYWGRLTSDYGYRRLFGRLEFHTGVDFAGPKGNSIVASDGGTVSFTGTKGGYGMTVIIDHDDGLQTLYAHCSRLLVKTGSKVYQGEVIAQVGSTGRSTGPHLHFEIRVNGQHVNPWKYLNKK